MDQNRENLFNYIMRNVRWLTVSQLLTLMLEVVREMQFRESMGRVNMVNPPPENQEDDDLDSVAEFSD